MKSLKGIITQTIGENVVKFRFSNHTQLLFLKLLREAGLAEDNLSHFEVRIYLFLAGLQAAGSAIKTVEDVCDLLDELSEDEQIKILEEAGEHLDFLGKLALDLRVQYDHSQEQIRILNVGRQMMAEIVAEEMMETLTEDTLDSISTPTETQPSPMPLSPNL